MQHTLVRGEMLRYEDIPDDNAFCDELIALVDHAVLRDDNNIWSGQALSEASAQAQSVGKKAWPIISAVLFYGLLATLIAGALFISQGDKKPVFGYSFMNVLTWSMEPDIPQGSLVIVKQVAPGEIKIGDDVTYMVDPETSVTHRVIGIRENFEGSGERGFETQGIANDAPDFEIVPAVNVAGVVKARVPLLGSWLSWLRENLLITAVFTIGIVVLVILLRGALRKSPVEEKKKRRKRIAPQAA